MHVASSMGTLTVALVSCGLRRMSRNTTQTLTANKNTYEYSIMCVGGGLQYIYACIYVGDGLHACVWVMGYNT